MQNIYKYSNEINYLIHKQHKYEMHNIHAMFIDNDFTQIL